MNKGIISKLSLVIIFISLNFFSYAGNPQYKGSVTLCSLYHIPGAPPPPVPNFNIKDFEFYNGLPRNYKDNYVTNYVKLYINHDDNTFLTTSFSYRVRLKITALDKNKKRLFWRPALTVSYSPGNNIQYQDKDVFQFSAGYDLTIEVDSVYDLILNQYVLSSANISNVIRLELSIQPDRDYNINTNQTPSGISYTYLPVSNDLLINWSTIPGADEYEIEWTYAPKCNAINTPPGQNCTETYDFRNNSTRVTTLVNSYKIPLVFDEGHLIFRIRGVDHDGEKYTYTQWSLSSNGNIQVGNSFYQVQDHDNLKNYQFGVDYAEGGKRKDVIKYYDGSLRERQILTRSKYNNDTQQTIIKETFYDYFGRPAVEALPAPAFNANFHYQSFFNKVVGSSEKYSKVYFDKDAGTAPCFNSSTSGMNNSNGASRYYSGNNPKKTIDYHKYIPDAANFPFSQVEYEPDNTGRIRRQGGIGAAFQLNSNHETKFYYSVPFPEEIDRLFGTEVGYSSHYKKNTQIDPNGQVSVSYLDMKGKVIATALAGDLPSMIEPLKDKLGNNLYNQNNTINVDLLAKSATKYPKGEKNYLIKYGYENHYEFTVPIQGSYNFQYNISTPQISMVCMGKCIDPVFNLEISLKDECGREKLLTSTQLKFTKTIGEKNLTDGSTCSGSVSYNSAPADNSIFQVQLGQGNYSINKKITIDESVFEQYWNDYEQNSGCLNSFEFFVPNSSQFSELCSEVNCSDCQSLIGTESQYLTQYGSSGITTETLKKFYKTLLDECKANCKQDNQCNLILEVILADVSPNGQYAEYIDTIAKTTTAENFPLSVLNSNNNLHKNNAKPLYNPNWRHPIYFGKLPGDSYSQWHDGYYDTFGIRAQVTVIMINTNYYPEINPNAVVRTDGERNYVYPEDLLNVEDFAMYFEPSWAFSLVPYHPEYEYYKCCINIESTKSTYNSIEYDAFSYDFMLNSFDFDAMISSGLMQIINGNLELFNKEPLNISDRMILRDRINSYIKIPDGNDTYVLSMYQMAYITTHCKDAKTLIEIQNCLSTVNNDPTLITDSDYETWEAFLGLYQSVKQSLIDNSIYSCGYPGSSYFDNKVIGNRLPNNNLYAYKVKRFGKAIDHVLNNMEVDIFPDNTKDKPEFEEFMDKFLAGELETLDDYLAYSDLLWDMRERLEEIVAVKRCVCPIVIQLEYVLNWLNRANKFFDATVGLADLPGLPASFFQVLNESSPYWVGNSNSAPYKSLTANLAGYDFSMEFPSGSSYDWNSNIQGLTGLFITNDLANGSFEFSIEALVLDGDEYKIVILTGTTNINLRDCSSEKCNMNNIGSDILFMMNGLAENGYLENSSNFPSDQFNRLISPNLKSIGLYGSNGIFGWSSTPSQGLFNLNNSYNPGNPPPYHQERNLKIEVVDGDDNPVDLTDIIDNITNIYYLGCSIDGKMKVKIVYTDPATGKIKSRIVYIKMSWDAHEDEGNPYGGAVNLCDCYLTTDSYYRKCNNIYNQNRIDLLEEFNQWAVDMKFGFLPPLVFIDMFGCNNNLTYADPLYSFAYMRDHIENFTTLKAAFPYSHGDHSFNYSIVAHFQNGDSTILYGRSCRGLSNCILCENDTIRVCCVKLTPTEEVDYIDPCISNRINASLMFARYEFEEYYKQKKQEFKDYYISEILNNIQETFTMSYRDPEYHFTLYYYDQAGNLIKTVPPKAVRILTDLGTDTVVTVRNANGFKKPWHNNDLSSAYRYNSLNQLVEEVSPDGGRKRIWYDKLGRVTASQNSNQENVSSGKSYNYNIYDDLGRVIETGEIWTSTAISDYDLENTTFYSASGSNKLSYIQTFYDFVPTSPVSFVIPGFTQENLRNRVTVSRRVEKDPSTYNLIYSITTFYSYDIHGNVKSIVIDNPQLNNFTSRYYKIDYDYDLISGKVNMVKYQEGKKDQFFHKYEYDDENRIINVQTSSDGVNWDYDAKYFYYLHGPLARTEVGDLKVQGVDYAYNLQGWIKGVNSNNLNPDHDMGKDGNTTGYNARIGRDAFGYTLNYYQNDYTPIAQNVSGFSNFEASRTSSDYENSLKYLYNGNISSMVTALMDDNQSRIDAIANVYTYDQLNRLKTQQAFIKSNLHQSGQDNWSGTQVSQKYKTELSYDANGNISTLMRNGDNASNLSMDDMRYTYNEKNNQLLWVNDFGLAGNYPDDFEAQSADNYDYDAIGNLKSDVQEQIESIKWTFDGKIRKIIRTQNSTKPDLEFYYDPMGNRVLKIVKNGNNRTAREDETNWVYTWYSRDAQGNIMSTYNAQYYSSAYNLKLMELHIYGSSRLGILDTVKVIATSATAPLIGHTSTLISAINSLSDIRNNTRDFLLGLIQNKDYYLPTDSVNVSAVAFIYTGNPLSNFTVDVDQIALYYQYNKLDTLNLISKYRMGFYQCNPRLLGSKRYELVNHLGNVLATVSDRKIAVSNGGTPQLIAYYEPDVRSSTDYYPFGVPMPGRSFSSPSYRFGFGGYEKVDEVNGTGNTVDMGDRWLDIRLGRTPKMDAKTNKYTGISPYAYALNNPISINDPDGKDVYLVIWATAKGEIGHAAIAVSNYRAVQTKVIENGKEVTKTDYVPDGTFTYYDLWPGGAGAGKENATNDIPAIYQKFDKVSWNGIFNEDPSKGEGRNPEGIVKLETTYEQDQKVIKALEDRINKNAPYNGVSNNCSDNAESGIEAATGTNINADEVIQTGMSATTPNSLFKATEKLPNAKVLRDPGDAVNNGFIEGAQGGATGKAAQKAMGGDASPARNQKNP